MSQDGEVVAILAGGLATRLLPETGSLPKALVDVAGQPFILHQLRLLRDNGLTRVVVCVGHLGEMIQDTLDQAELPGMDVRFSYDGPHLLGTAGALRKAAPMLADAFFVLYGDSYLTCDFRAVGAAFEANGKPGLMTVFRNDGQWDTSNVEFADGRLLAYDKIAPTARMQHIDYGLGVLARSSLQLVPPDEPLDLARLYAMLLARGELAAYEVADRFYEIGSPTGLAEVRALLAPVSPALRSRP